MTTAKGKNPQKPAPKATPAPPGRELQAGPLTQLLIKARQRIVNPVHWARGAYARDAAANPVNVMDAAAVCWCAIGTLERECGNHMPSWDTPTPEAGVKRRTDPLYHAAHAILETASKALGSNGSITALNDGGGHARVLLMYNKAIVAAQGK